MHNGQQRYRKQLFCYSEVSAFTAGYHSMNFFGTEYSEKAYNLTLLQAQVSRTSASIKYPLKQHHQGLRHENNLFEGRSLLGDSY